MSSIQMPCRFVAFICVNSIKNASMRRADRYKNMSLHEENTTEAIVAYPEPTYWLQTYSGCKDTNKSIIKQQIYLFFVEREEIREGD